MFCFFSESLDLKSALAEVIAKDLQKKCSTSDGDFIGEAIRAGVEFDTDSWPKCYEKSINAKYPVVVISKCENKLLRTFVYFCQKFEHRPLPPLNAENPLKAVPRKDTLQSLKDKYPGNCRSFGRWCWERE
jgi:hypothetical protein